jgi:choline dehydrogenase-like flavoprotein
MSTIDAGMLPRDAVLDTDICIVGSGAAGITLAHRLLEAGGNQRICMLESSLVDERTDTAAEQLAAVQRFETTSSESARMRLGSVRNTSTWNRDHHRHEDPAAQPLYQGQLTGPLLCIDQRFLLRSRVRVFGGSTNCWGGWTRTLSPIDFDRSDLDSTWVWPITAAQLRPYYQAALAYCSLGEFDPDDYDRPEAWIGRTDLGIAVPPLATGNVRTGVFTVMNGSGPHEDGALDFQKVWGAALERADRVTLVRNANVRSLAMDATGRQITKANVQAIQRSVTPVPGVPFSVRARHYVLAAGGIETVRLLLLSGAVGDSAGHLGRNFMVHPLNDRAGQLFTTAGATAGVHNFFSNWPSLKGHEWAPYVLASFVPTDRALRQLGIGNFRALIDFGSGCINLSWEQVPNPTSRIRLSETRDLFGDPEVWLDWHTTDVDARTAKTALELVMAEAKALGYANGGIMDPRITAVGDHHMGAARMSQQSRDGYVDPNCRAHDVANLYIAGSAVFPTGGVANPTLTIIALAARLADHLARQ